MIISLRITLIKDKKHIAIIVSCKISGSEFRSATALFVNSFSEG